MSGVPTPTDSPEDGDLRVDLSPTEKALTIPEMRAFTHWIDQRFADQLAYRVRWQIAFQVGLRQAELLGLTWNCINLATRTITVRQQLRHIEHQHGCTGDWPDPKTSPCTLEVRATDPHHKPVSAYRCPQRVGAQDIIVGTTKSKRVRYVRVSAGVAEQLTMLWAEQHPVDTPEPVKRERQRLHLARSMRVYAVADADLVIRNERGRHVTPSADNTMWHAACAGSAVSSIGRDVHAARHTAATHLVASGAPLTTVQKILGHSTLDGRSHGAVRHHHGGPSGRGTRSARGAPRSILTQTAKFTRAGEP